MNLMNREPLGLKLPKAKKNPAYLQGVRGLPCIICTSFGMQQQSPTTAHHTICGRHSTRKTPDEQAIPLCDGHHQGDFDTSKIAIHRDRALWVDWYGPDTDYIAATQDALAHILETGN